VTIVQGTAKSEWYVDGKRYALAEHRIEMERKLGRRCIPENVHHKNGHARTIARRRTLDEAPGGWPAGETSSTGYWTITSIVEERLKERHALSNADNPAARLKTS
jgi:hypothetical protein